MNISVFRFKIKETEVAAGGWERLVLNSEQQRIKSKISNFDDELERVNDIYNKNEQCMNRYLNVQCDLMNIKQRVVVT
jgi:hypothetical protein